MNSPDLGNVSGPEKPGELHEGVPAHRSREAGANKGVTIAEPEHELPTPSGQLNSRNHSFSGDQGAKQHRVKVGRRLIGRRPSSRSNTSLENLADQLSLDGGSDGTIPSRTTTPHASLLFQIRGWLSEEKKKIAAKRAKRKQQGVPGPDTRLIGHSLQDGDPETEPRRSTDSSDDATVALEKLERILTSHSTAEALDSRRPSLKSRQSSKARKLRRQSSSVFQSDTESSDIDFLVPSCDVILDNTKTLGYTGGTALATPTGPEHVGRPASIISTKGQDAWHQFKYEIVRLAHTLKLKGWRRVLLEWSSEVEVERLSGALTNAVYVVGPPKNMPPRETEGDSEKTQNSSPNKPPPKLLLRIYGPQVEHLIDREAELLILRRLAKKSIGPRLLGTFANGRFEQFFHARTLTPYDLRVPETSTQIAKRMKELHVGIQLLEQEREGGPFIWKNWDKWVKRVAEVSSWLDSQITSKKPSAPCAKVKAWRDRGFVCGVEWSVFQKTVDTYRAWLDEQYGGPSKIRDKLVFAHNDTQYGNILRLEPPGESPLLHPVNEHKQLIVIDFEYANANLPGLEFTNHFTEWCYNYHDAAAPWRCNTSAYPTPEEQRRFIRAYVRHRPQFSSRPTTTNSSTTSLPSLRLDNHRSSSQTLEQEDQLEKETKLEVDRLTYETRLWRVANSAQWVAWGIVQAKIPGMPNDNASQPVPEQDPDDQQIEAPQPLKSDQATDPLDAEAVQMKQDLADRRPEPDNDVTAIAREEDGEEEFDYLAYAHDRALFFWGDVLQLGLVPEDELPVGLVERVKRVRY